ncbi:MAG: PQQ-dependent sugar dehydrogenase [Myxococcaceae bacterium]
MKKALFSLALLCAGVSSADTLTDAGYAQNFTLSDYVPALGDVTDFRFLPDGRMVIIEKAGRVYVRTAGGVLAGPTQFTNIDTSSEKGLLGVEVHPNFSQNHLLFFYYSRPSGSGTFHRVVTMELKNDNSVDLATETVLVDGLLGPANHDGGGLAIGPDGKLYIGVGDTGNNSQTTPDQNITNWFATCSTLGNGKILRVNLDGTIPNDNPLASATAATACGAAPNDQPDPNVTGTPRKDIYAWGFRNPWRFWFDPLTGQLWVGDVGEVTFEEIDLVQKGKHYGWPLREGGGVGLDAGLCDHYVPGTGNCQEPVYYCQHGTSYAGVDTGCTSITGGLIVDSCTWPAEFRGQYYFADNYLRFIYALPVNSTRTGFSGPRVTVGRASTNQGPVAMHTGPDGALYFAMYPLNTGGQGRIVRMAPINPIACDLDAGVDAGLPGSDGGAGGGSGGGTGGISPGGPEPIGGGTTTTNGGCHCNAADAGGMLALFGVIALIARARRRAA